MSIIVDTTNIVQSGFDLNSISITLLRELATERGHQLVLPDVVVEELRNKRREQAQADLSAFQSALSRVRKFHPIENIPLPEAEHVANIWLSLLGMTFDVEPVLGDEARAALFREAAGRAPTAKKEGARDASIWEVTKRLHLDGDADTYFVSHNTRDFGDPRSSGALHPDLVAELGETAGRFHYLQTIDDVLNELGTRLDEQLTVLDLDSHSPATAAVQGWIQLYPQQKASSSWEQVGRRNPPSSIVVNPDVEALPVAVESSQAYEVGGRRVTVARTRWQLSYEILAVPGEDDISSIHLAGDVSVLLLLRDLEDGSRAAEVINGEDLTLTVFRTS